MFPQSCKGLLVIAGLFVPIISATADDGRGFYQKNFALRWDEKARPNSSTTIEFDKREKPAEEVAPQGEQMARGMPEPKSSLQDAPYVNTEKPFYPEMPKDRESIAAKYGSPTDDRNIVPRGDSPPEFMAMSAALNIGDEQLAFDYARAYARRNKRLQDFVERANQFNMLAMEAEGYVEGPNIKDPRTDITPERKQLQDQLERAKQERLKAMTKAKFDEKADALLRAAEEEAKKADVRVPTPEATSSGEIPLEVPPPVDPEGRVMAMVFFAPGEVDMKDFLNQMDDLSQRFRGDKRLDIRLLSTRSLTEEQLVSARESLDPSLKVQNGYELAKHFNVVKVPTVVLVTQTTKEVFPMEGTTSAPEVERIIRMMQGGTRK